MRHCVWTGIGSWHQQVRDGLGPHATGLASNCAIQLAMEAWTTKSLAQHAGHDAVLQSNWVQFARYADPDFNSMEKAAKSC